MVCGAHLPRSGETAAYPRLYRKTPSGGEWVRECLEVHADCGELLGSMGNFGAAWEALDAVKSKDYGREVEFFPDAATGVLRRLFAAWYPHAEVK